MLKANARTKEIAQYAHIHGVTDAAMQYNVSEKTVRNYVALEGTPPKNAVKQTLKHYEKQVQAQASEIETLQSRVDVFRALDQHARTFAIPKRVSKGHEATAFGILSDIHIEEQIVPEKVNYLNEYNPQIAKRRLSNFFERFVRLTEIQRHGVQIKTCVLAILGDVISGYIHEELTEGNAMSPSKAVVYAYNCILSGIMHIKQYGGFEKIVVVCNTGNHGRTTDKTRVATREENSFEWLMYNFLADKLSNETSIEVLISKAYHFYLELYGKKIRMHHGDAVRYAGGVGGIFIPINKAIAQWNKSITADFDVFGHFHTHVDGGNFISNGSVIGYSPYAIKIKAGYEQPSQTFFLYDEKYGKTLTTPLYLD